MQTITNFMFPAPTDAAIDTAIRNAETMHGAYTVTPTETGDLFIVQNIANGARCYGVTTIPDLHRCGCPQFKRANICKHQIFVQEYLNIVAQEEAFEARNAEREYAEGCIN